MIRLGKISDIDAVMALETEAFTTDRLSRRSVLYMLKNPQAAVWVMEQECGVMAYAILLQHRLSKFARLYSLALALSCQGKGFADVLMDHLEHHCSKPGVKLEVRQDNTRAQAFYYRRGYETIGCREAFYSDGMAAMLMRKGF